MYIIHSCLLSHIYEQFLLKPHFQGQNSFEPNVFKFISSSPFAFLIINVKIFSNFQKEWTYTFGREKKTFEKNKDYPLLKFESFEHAKTFLICVKL
jgi:hypothetical protein